ncbi:TetR/AcrR family transcriptional regulator [Bacillus infantis]|uniref:TetR/AcrR family transcriptional regulator n=1 Tax=Bacillus infantis TaxID=324767 RepID=UPI003CEC0985
MPEQESLIYYLFGEQAGLTEKQKSILLAAIQMFSEKGFSATSTSEIAKLAGVAEGTIFRHYKTKKDLLLAIVEPIMSDLVAPYLIQDIEQVLKQRPIRYEDFLRSLLDNRIAFLKKNLPIFKILIQEIPFHPDLKKRFIEQIAEKVFQQFIKIVEYYQEQGQIIPDIPPKSIVRMTFSALIGHLAIRYLFLPEAEWDDDAEVERTIHFVMNGLSPLS